MRGFHYILTALILGGSASALAQTTITLKEYVQQVETNHKGLGASSILGKAFLQQSVKGETELSPNLFMSGSHDTSKNEQLGAFTPKKLTEDKIQIGVEKKFITGTHVKTYFENKAVDQEGFDPQFGIPDKYNETRPVIEITQPLLRNWLGRETQAQILQAEAKAKSQGYDELFKRRKTLSEIEIVYWNLALARQTLRIKEATLQRAKTLMDWAKRRANLELTDDSDYLQAQAAYQQRVLEEQSARDEERAAAQLFNAARGIDSTYVKEQLEDFTQANSVRMQLPDQAPKREDVVKAEYDYKLSEAAADKSYEELMPNLELKAIYRQAGRDEEFSEAYSEGFSSDYPGTTVGLNLTWSLDFGLKKKLKEAYEAEKAGAKQRWERTVFDSQVEWETLKRNLQESIKRFELAQELEKVQKAKLQYEERRHRRGRTTTFQVLQFESDYSLAQLNRLSEQAKILHAVAKLKTFGGIK